MIHLIAADARIALDFSLSPGQASDGSKGRKLLARRGSDRPQGIHNVLMDKAYEADETRQLVFDLYLVPVVPPKANRLNPWKSRQAAKSPRRCIFHIHSSAPLREA